MSEPAEEVSPLDELLEFLHRHRGFDFTGYKRPSLERRINKRLEATGCPDYGDYLNFLEVHPDEFARLFDTILINVTGFFRDQAAWSHLQREVIPALLAAKDPSEPIRVWSAGCASGEEAYSVAMLLADALGDEEFRRRVKVYGTDADEEALSTARHSSYPIGVAEDIPPELAGRYLERTDHHYTFRKDLRRSVIFGRNDLVQDAPISRIDLLLCRNTLMYFTAEMQAQILRRFYFALRDEGLMFLGKSEMLLTHSESFKPIDIRCRVFRKVPSPPRASALASGRPPADEVGEYSNGPEGLRDGAFDLGPIAQVVIDGDGVLAMTNQRARLLFRLGPVAIGRPLRDLELSYRPLELRSVIEQAVSSAGPVTISDVPWSAGPGDDRLLDVVVSPVFSDTDGTGAAITFADVTHERRLQEDLERSRRELEVAYEELQSTVEELETTNEELQSTNEELETTNEELQSTNEELETMNEELHSSNEELQGVNSALRQRTSDLHRTNSFVSTILASLGLGVIALDAEGNVLLWNDGSRDLWGLREDEVAGQHVLSLDIGLPLDAVGPLIQSVLAGGSDREELEVDAVNRRGRQTRCVVTCLPLRTAEEEIEGAVVLVEEARGGVAVP